MSNKLGLLVCGNQYVIMLIYKDIYTSEFSYENPESKIFKNAFQEQLGEELDKDLNEDNMIEMEDFSNKQELEIWSKK